MLTKSNPAPKSRGRPLKTSQNPAPPASSTPAVRRPTRAFAAPTTVEEAYALARAMGAPLLAKALHALDQVLDQVLDDADAKRPVSRQGMDAIKTSITYGGGERSLATHEKDLADLTVAELEAIVRNRGSAAKTVTLDNEAIDMMG